MKLAYKQLLKETMKNKIFVSLMLLLTFLTSFMYFFVHYSIDGNLRTLNALPKLTENQILYQNALNANTNLASTILLSFISLTAFVFGMFFYRFFKQNSKVLGTLKTLGFKDQMLRHFFVVFSAVLSVIGSILGVGISYFPANLLLQANSRSYEVSDLVKTVSLSSILIGIFIPMLVLCLIAFLAYGFIQGKDIAQLVSPSHNNFSYNLWLRLANRLAQFYPSENQSAMRLALRKPITLLLIFIAVTCFSVMFLMAYSLNLSSQTIYDSQTKGHYYLVDTHLSLPQTFEITESNVMPYLDTQGTLSFANTTISQQVIGFEKNSTLFELLDAKGQVLSTPHSGEIVISPALHELYGLQIGDVVTLEVAHKATTLVVSQIAFNAKLNSVYMAPSDLSTLLELPAHTYTGIWSTKKMVSTLFAKLGTVTTFEEKLDTLNRSFVSNRSSAVITQVMGCVIGCILLFLALLLNFQDSTRDIFILYLMGYKTPAIRKMLIDLYQPIIWIFFVISLYPAIMIVQTILRSLSLQIGDYMPFQTNLLVILGIFILLNIIYLLVQFTFNLGIKKIIKSDQIYAYTNTN